VQQHTGNILQILAHLISIDTRMEVTSLQIAAAVFEKMGIPSEDFLKNYLVAIFQTLHFYRNNTVNRQIPVKIVKSVWSFLACFMIYHGLEKL
jgi:hypothetical protein